MKRVRLFLFPILMFAVCLIAGVFVNTGVVFADSVLSDVVELKNQISAATTEEKTIEIGGDFVLSSEIAITGSRKIILKAVRDTNFIRQSPTSIFNMIRVDAGSSLKIQAADGFAVNFDGNCSDVTSLNIPTSTPYLNSIFYVKGELFLDENITLQNNKNTLGAAIYNDNGVVYCGGIKIYKNIAFDNGGAIYNNGKLTLTNCKISNNQATMFGGAIINYATLIVENSSFDNNVVTSEAVNPNIPNNAGGAICVSSGKVNISNSIFDSNKVVPAQSGNQNNVSAGGAITVKGTADVTIGSNTIFSSNNAPRGGAIAVFDGNLTVNGATLSNNWASSNGGAIYVDTAASSKVCITATLSNNRTIATTSSEQNCSNEVFWKFASENSDYLASNLLDVNITTSGTKAIYAANNLPIGENFALADGSSVNLTSGKQIYVKQKLKTANSILSNWLTTEDLGGQILLVFANKNVVTERLFVLLNNELSLVPQNPNYSSFDDATPVEFIVKTEYNINFYTYKEGEILKDKIGETVKVGYGESVAMPAAPTRAGYKFVGWTNDLGQNASNITASVDFYAVWKKECTVEFYSKNGTDYVLLASKIVLEGDKLIASDFPDITSREDYDPVNYNTIWALNPFAQPLEDFDISTAISSNLKLYLCFQPKTIDVTFVFEDSAIAPVVKAVPYNQKFSLNYDEPDITSREGYSVHFWAYANGERFDKNTVIKTPITLYEKHIIDEFVVTFKLNFIYKGEIVDTKVIKTLDHVVWGTTLSEMPAVDEFITEGYSQLRGFVWYYNNEQIKSNTDVFADVYNNQYNVEFVVDEKVVKTMKVDHGSVIASEDVPAIAEKEQVGYNFIGSYWNKNVAEPINSDTKFVAMYKYEIKKFDVTFVDENGNIIKVERVEYGSNANTDNLIDIHFGELLKMDKSPKNITSNLTIKVWKINILIWIILGIGLLVLIIALIIIIKIVKKKKINNLARKNSKDGPFI